MDQRDVIAIMAASIYASRANHEFGSRNGMDNALDEARMILGMVKNLDDDDLVMGPFAHEDD